MDATDYAASDQDWLKATDLQGKTITLEVESVEVCTFGENDPAKHKLGLRFKGKDRGIVSNKTNTKKLVAAWGAETDNWTGKKVIAAPNETALGLGFALTPAPEDFDDAIPF